MSQKTHGADLKSSFEIRLEKMQGQAPNSINIYINNKFVKCLWNRVDNPEAIVAAVYEAIAHGMNIKARQIRRALQIEPAGGLDYSEEDFY